MCILEDIIDVRNKASVNLYFVMHLLMRIEMSLIVYLCAVQGFFRSFPGSLCFSENKQIQCLDISSKFDTEPHE